MTTAATVAESDNMMESTSRSSVNVRDVEILAEGVVKKSDASTTGVMGGGGGVDSGDGGGDGGAVVVTRGRLYEQHLLFMPFGMI